MMVGISRRSLLAAGLLAPAMTGIGARRAVAQTKALRIGTWGGSWRDALDASVISKIPSPTPPVEYVLGNPDDNLAKLVAARRQNQTPFDVWECKPDEAAGMVKANLLESIDYAQVPNAAIPAHDRDAGRHRLQRAEVP